MQYVWYMCFAVLVAAMLPYAIRAEYIGRFYCAYCGQKLQVKKHQNKVVNWFVGFRFLCPDHACLANERKTKNIRKLLLNVTQIVSLVWLPFYVLIMRGALIEEAEVSVSAIDAVSMVLFAFLVVWFTYEAKRIKNYEKSYKVV